MNYAQMKPRTSAPVAPIAPPAVQPPEALSAEEEARVAALRQAAIDAGFGDLVRDLYQAGLIDGWRAIERVTRTEER